MNEAHALQQDAHEAWRSFHSGAYKAATVMAGAVLEGLVQQACAKLGERAHQAFATLHKGRAPKGALQFTVDEGLAVLRECGVLSSALTHTAKGLKEMRNFVHPDLARKQKRAMQNTHALLALGPMHTRRRNRVVIALVRTGWQARGLCSTQSRQTFTSRRALSCVIVADSEY